MSDSLSASTIQLAGHGGDGIEAYLARPDGSATRGGVVVIHHMPGYDRASKEMVRRFAGLGYEGELADAMRRWSGNENLEERVDGIDSIDPVVLRALREAG